MSDKQEEHLPGYVVHLLPMALRDALEVAVYRGTELELLPPDLVFIMLNTDEVLRDAPLDNCPAHPYAGRASPEIALGSSRHPVPGESLAELDAITPGPSGRSATATSGSSATGYAGSATTCASITAGSTAAPSSLAVLSSGTGSTSSTT